MSVVGGDAYLCYDFHRVTSLSSETLPLLCVTFITENSLVAAVSIKYTSNIFSERVYLFINQLV